MVVLVMVLLMLWGNMADWAEGGERRRGPSHSMTGYNHATQDPAQLWTHL